MTRTRQLWALLLILLTGWAIVIHEIFENDGLIVSLTFLGTVIVAIAVMRILALSMPLQRLEDIHRLTQEIDERMSTNPSPIDENNAPKEILPIIQATNRLIRYQEDRYENERDFTANASHELRTPLAGIRLQTQIAMRSNDTAARNRAFDNVMRAVDRATMLVEQLLVLSRLTAEKVEFNRAAIDLNKLAMRVTAELSEWMSDRQASVVIQRNPGIMLNGNAESLAILINNLIRNAITHAQGSPHVDVSVRDTGDGVVLEVADNGPGIPEAEMKQVMERFAKASGSKGGTGLGLAIVKRIADLHNARIGLANREQGTGLIVTITFPAGGAV